MSKIARMLALLLCVASLAAGADDALRQAIAGAHRTPAFVARDAVRKPYEELMFLGLRPDATVVEISPGGGYWTEILAPYLRDKGSSTSPSSPSRASRAARATSAPTRPSRTSWRATSRSTGG